MKEIYEVEARRERRAFQCKWTYVDKSLVVNANVFLLNEQGEENEVETSEKRRGMEEKVSAWGEKNTREKFKKEGRIEREIRTSYRVILLFILTVDLYISFYAYF